MPSWSQKMEARTFPVDFYTRNIWGRVSCYGVIPLIIAFSPGFCDISSFRPWSPIVTGNYLDRTKKFPNLLRRIAPAMFLIRVQAFRDPLRGELPHAQIFMNAGPNAVTWDAHLLDYWFSRNPAVFQEWLLNLINNFRGWHSLGYSRTRITGEKITFTLSQPVFHGGMRWCTFP
jgi:hypothetical protein